MSPTPGDFILLEIICTYFPDGVDPDALREQLAGTAGGGR